MYEVYGRFSKGYKKIAKQVRRRSDGDNFTATIRNEKERRKFKKINIKRNSRLSKQK